MRARARGARGGAVMLIGKRVERFGKTVESPKDLQSSIAPSSLFYVPQLFLTVSI